MPLLECDSSKDQFFSPNQGHFDVYQDFAISFTFCKESFIESVLAFCTRRGFGKDKRSRWHVIVVHLGEYQSFLAQVQALVVMMEEQHTIAAGGIHILFADGDLF